MQAFDQQASGPAFRRICAQHTAVIPTEAYSLLADSAARARAVAHLQQENAALHSEVRRLRAREVARRGEAYVDVLTGLGNQHAFDLHLEREWALTRRDAPDSFVVLAELDGFAALNDRHGLGTGDQVLRQFAEALRLAARATDIVARIGDGEFAVLLIRCDEGATHRFTARLHELLAMRTWPQQADVAASIGHASLKDSAAPVEALSRAALAMLERTR
jgi:diguanylate cyclase